MILNRGTLSALTTGFKSIFNAIYVGVAPQWDKVAMKVPSSTSQETYAWLKLLPRFREWLGDRVVQNLGSSDFTLKNKTFENTIGVDRENIEDDQVGVYKPVIEMLAHQAATHPDRLVFQLLKDGFASKCYDGQYFFDTDHPVLDAAGAVQSVANTDGGAGTPWFLCDTTKPIKPLILQMRKEYTFVSMDKPDDEAVFTRKQFRYGVDARLNVGFGLWQLAWGSKQALDEAHYAAARAALGSMKADNGEVLGITPNLLCVPPALEGAAKKLVAAEYLGSGANNPFYKTAEVHVVPWLA